MKDFCLSTLAIKANYKLVQFEETNSTNKQAMSAATQGHDENTWFVTKKQSAGKGRLGRDWQSLEGNLTASLLVQVELEPNKCAMLGFVAGVALIMALKAFDKEIEAKLKWPNDVLLNGTKLAGILLEMQSLKNGKQAIVIGFGINVASSPTGLPYAATSLNEHGLDIDCKQLFMALSESFTKAFEIFMKNEHEIIKQWQQNGAGLGKEISIINHGVIINGIFEDIDKTGRLIIKLANGEKQYISAGDMQLGATTNKRENNGE